MQDRTKQPFGEAICFAGRQQPEAIRIELVTHTAPPRHTATLFVYEVEYGTCLTTSPLDWAASTVERILPLVSDIFSRSKSWRTVGGP